MNIYTVQSEQDIDLAWFECCAVLFPLLIFLSDLLDDLDLDEGIGDLVHGGGGLEHEQGDLDHG